MDITLPYGGPVYRAPSPLLAGCVEKRAYGLASPILLATPIDHTWRPAASKILASRSLTTFRAIGPAFMSSPKSQAIAARRQFLANSLPLLRSLRPMSTHSRYEALGFAGGKDTTRIVPHTGGNDGGQLRLCSRFGARRCLWSCMAFSFLLAGTVIDGLDDSVDRSSMTSNISSSEGDRRPFRG